MSPTVTAIDAPKPGSRARCIRLDGEIWRTTSARAVKRLHLSVGDSVDVGDLTRRLDETERMCAKERALELIAYRERSSGETIARLSDEGYDERIAHAVVSGLVDAGLIDDERFAVARARSLAARGYGRHRIARDLASAAIGEAVIEHALEEASPPSDEERARDLASRMRAPDERSLVTRLLRRGFDVDVARRAAREAFAARQDPFDEPHMRGE